MSFRDGTDTVTFFLASSDAREHSHTLGVELTVVDRSERTLAVGRVSLNQGETGCGTLTFRQATPAGVSLRMTVGFEEFAGGGVYGNVSVPYLLAYQGNELVDLFNAAGSDKGTEVRVGQGAPHCYAVEYFDLFRGLREDPFRLLEIGLQSEQPDNAPSDAPSLRVWHDFFPRAQIHGYDINDFSFFEQDRTLTFQGDQGSRDDLERFVSAYGAEKFGLILDDGSHASSHQQISLGSLFECVEPGGLYVIEDLHWQPFPESPTTLEVLRDFIEGGQIRSPFLRDNEARYLKEVIDGVEIHRPNDSEFAVIHKKAA